MSRWPALVLVAAIFSAPFIVGCEDHDRDSDHRDRVYRDDDRVQNRDWHDQHSDRGYYDRY